MKDFEEKIPKPVIGNCESYYKYIQEEKFNKLSLLDTKEDIGKLARKLSNLPQITGGFLAFLIERRDKANKIEGYSIKFN